MTKRMIHAEIDENTYIDSDGINKGLKRLCKLAEESNYFEDVLNSALKSLYQTLPKGKENYGDRESKIGSIYLSRFNNRDGNVNVEYYPSKILESKLKYSSAKIAEINIKEKTFFTNYSKISLNGIEYDESFFEYPKDLMKDTEIVMKMLGLNQVFKK